MPLTNSVHPLIRTLLFATIFLASNLYLSADAEEIVLRGNINGASGHESSGTVFIIKGDDGGYMVQLQDDFFLDSAPGPYVGFGNPSYIKKAEVSQLLKIRGKQSYALDSDYAPEQYSHFYVWCKPFNTALGVAVLKP